MELFVGKLLLHDALLNIFPFFLFQHEIGDGFPAILCKIEKQMFDAWGI